VNAVYYGVRHVAEGGAPIPSILRPRDDSRRKIQTMRGWMTAFLLLLCFCAPSLQAQTFQLLHAFQGWPDGEGPQGGAIADAKGQVYGTTVKGGANNLGSLFKVDPSGTEILLHSFTDVDGQFPDQGLTLDDASEVYGVTPFGGDFGACPETGCGVVFKVDAAGNFAVLHTFEGGVGDGLQPEGAMALDAAGNVYGSTYYGGSNGTGTIFKLDANGNETVLDTSPSFAASQPFGPLFLGRDGTIFGTGSSTVFEVFPGLTGRVIAKSTPPTLYAPRFGVVQDPTSGELYGTNVAGAVKVDPSTSELTPIQSFPDTWAYGEGLVRDSSGYLYGTTMHGGLSTSSECNYSGGVVFRLDLVTAVFTPIYEFTGGQDGCVPGPLSIDRNGDLYGTTQAGGSGPNCGDTGCGTVYKITLPRMSFGGSVQQPLTRDSQGNYVAQITVTNNGNLPIDSAQVGVASTTLGSGHPLEAPPPVVNLAPAASAAFTLTFPPNSVKEGANSATLKVDGTYDVRSILLKGGNWALSFRTVSLP
jgi:uncharacterized repeat protein (TIGR03803 family)